MIDNQLAAVIRENSKVHKSLLLLLLLLFCNYLLKDRIFFCKNDYVMGYPRTGSPTYLATLFSQFTV